MALVSDNHVDWMYLDQVDYSKCLSLQRELQKKVSFNNQSEGFLLLVQHKPVVTIGRFGKESNILLPENEMKKRGIEIWRIERGGDVTFHGPGQLIGYPIINLVHYQLGVKSYVQMLEEALINVLKKFGIEAGRIKEHPGVWVGKEKVAAIGVYVKDSTTMHGFALNVNTDLDYFSLIVPCGISNMGVTSMKKILGEDIPLRQVAAIFAKEFGAVFGTNMRRHTLLD
ncbi:MAG: lipoyl(octanoyl) transferase LipB [Thermodesulfobacteriota bacterium]